MPDPEFLLLGDALWLDFLNTACNRPPVGDLLVDSAAYLRWTKAVRVEPPVNAGAFREARVFREHLHSLALALEAGRSLPPSAIAAVNGRLRGLDGREQLVRIAGTWHIRFVPARALTALEAVARSAGQTLANPEVAVRRCANPDCGLFLADNSPHQTRRLCSPARCGQRGQVERRRITRPAPMLAEG